MKLRKPCEHNLYDEHPWGGYLSTDMCPGGAFLPDDTLEVWWCEQKQTATRYVPWECECGSSLCPGHESCRGMVLIRDDDRYNALSVREAE